MFKFLFKNPDDALPQLMKCRPTVFPPWLGGYSKALDAFVFFIHEGNDSTRIDEEGCTTTLRQLTLLSGCLEKLDAFRLYCTVLYCYDVSTKLVKIITPWICLPCIQTIHLLSPKLYIYPKKVA